VNAVLVLSVGVIVTALVIRLDPPLNVSERALVVNVLGTIGLEKVTVSDETGVLRVLGSTGVRLVIVGGVLSNLA
jgi:hypothetical protein